MPNEVIHILGETAHLSSLGFGVVTTDGIINYANPAFCEMFLIATSETYIGQSLLEFPSISSNASFTELKLAFACPDSAAIQFHFDRPGRGRPCTLSEAQKTIALQHIKESPRSLNKVIADLEKEFDMSLSLDILKSLCKAARLVWKRVRRSLRSKRDQVKFDAATEEIK